MCDHWVLCTRTSFTDTKPSCCTGGLGSAPLGLLELPGSASRRPKALVATGLI